jgi:hypothetical protein
MKKDIKVMMFAAILLISMFMLPDGYAATCQALTDFTCIGNITNAAGDGWTISNYSCTGSSWGLSATSCASGDTCLRSTIGVGGSSNFCSINQSKFLMSRTRTYLFKGWMKDELISASGGYAGVGYVNSTTGPLIQFPAIQCESDKANRKQNASGLDNFQSLSTVCSSGALWHETIFNGTSGWIGFAVYDGPAHATTYYRNFTMMKWQSRSGYIGFYRFRNVNYGDTAVYVLDTATPTTQTPTPTNLRNTSVGFTNVTLNWTGNMGSKYLLFQNGTNVVNMTTRPYVRTGLSSGTKYGFKIKAYNSSYSLALSNFSNQINVTTKSQPSLTLKTNIIQLENYTMNPFRYGFNGTTTSVSSKVFNCTLFQCDHFPTGCPDTSIYRLANNATANVSRNNILSWDTTDWWGWINTTLYCKNAETSATLERDFYIDTVKPVISYVQGANNSRLTRGIQTALPFIVRFTDDSSNLYQVNTSLCAWSSTKNTCDQQIANWNNKFLGDNDRLINVTMAMSSIPRAYSKFHIYSQAWDAHTAVLIDDYQLDYISDGLKTGVRIENGLEITSPDADSIELIKEFDRYSFNVDLKAPTDDIQFNLKSNGNLTYLSNSPYLGHFIDWDRKKWIDFETENAESVSLVKVSDKEYQVTVHMKNTKDILPVELEQPADVITFHSIGDLNYVQSYIYFNVTNGSTVRAKDRLSGLNIQNITVKVYTYPNTLVQTKSTTNYNVTFNITGGTYYINISGTVGGQRYVTNVTANKTFSANMLYTTYLTLSNSLYLFIFDEVANKLITDRTVTIDVINYLNESNTYTTTTGSTFQYGFTAGFYELNYRATNYTPRSYYTSIQGGDTQTLYLYLLNDTEIEASHQYVNYDSVDESAAPLPNSTIKMQRYMVSNSTWRTVEMSIANDQGQGFLFADLYDATYRFIVEYPFGTTRTISAQFKLDGRDLFFSSSLLDIGLTNYYESGDVATTITFSNATKIWTYSFNGASAEDVSAGRFLVTKLTTNARTTICNTTVSASSGGMTCNLTAYATDDSTFFAQGFVTFASDDTEYLVEATSMTITKNFLRYGLNGLYLSFIAVGTMAFIGIFSPVGAIIMAILGLIITTMMGLLYMSYTLLAGIIIVGLIYVYNMRQ